MNAPEPFHLKANNSKGMLSNVKLPTGWCWLLPVDLWHSLPALATCSSWFVTRISCAQNEGQEEIGVVIFCREENDVVIIHLCALVFFWTSWRCGPAGIWAGVWYALNMHHYHIQSISVRPSLHGNSTDITSKERPLQCLQGNQLPVQCKSGRAKHHMSSQEFCMQLWSTSLTNTTVNTLSYLRTLLLTRKNSSYEIVLCLTASSGKSRANKT